MSLIKDLREACEQWKSKPIGDRPYLKDYLEYRFGVGVVEIESWDYSTRTAVAVRLDDGQSACHLFR